MPSVEIKDVYKIFGDNPDAALELMEHGKDKEEIKKGTGQVVGVQGISFQIDDNELFVIMGLSGSGKSTLLRCVNRLVEPTSGEITLHTEERDFDVLAADRETLRQLREKQISMVFQNFALFPERTVVNNVAFGLEIQGIGRKKG